MTTPGNIAQLDQITAELDEYVTTGVTNLLDVQRDGVPGVQAVADMAAQLAREHDPIELAAFFAVACKRLADAQAASGVSAGVATRRAAAIGAVRRVCRGRAESLADEVLQALDDALNPDGGVR